jgi:hypothetical protein
MLGEQPTWWQWLGAALIMAGLLLSRTAHARPIVAIGGAATLLLSVMSLWLDADNRVIDALYGGVGKYHTRIEGRDFSPTELRVIYRLVETVVAEYRKAWTGIYPVELEYQRSEMQPQFCNVAPPSEVVVATSFASPRRNRLQRLISACSMNFCRPSRSAQNSGEGSKPGASPL